MIYGSVCSGIEAASVAWEPLGWRPAWFAEIDPFASAVLAHRYPIIPNLGDFTKIGAEHGPIDLLVGGTPCQAFSVAGKRAGLDDPRGNLTLEYLALADRLRPRWLVWENVPGVLSIDEGRTFGTFLGILGELGYGFAYRVLDAQHFGVPQRRRRVFVVGHSGGLWQRAAAVLFEQSSLSGNPPPSRETGQDVAGTLKGGSGERGYPDPSGGNGGGLVRVAGSDLASCRAYIPDIAGTLDRGIPGRGAGNAVGYQDHLVASTLTAHAGLHDKYGETFVTHSLRAEGFDASEDGTGRGTPLVVGTLTSNGDAHSGFKDERGLVPVALASTLAAYQGRNQIEQTYVPMASTVRRLTPVECERLQGFSDDWTQVPYRGKSAADGPRYRAIGNSMAVPVMAWIGSRIAAVEQATSGATGRQPVANK